MSTTCVVKDACPAIAALSLQELGLKAAVDRRVLGGLGLVQPFDQLVQPRGQDDEVTRRLRPALPNVCATPAGTSTVEPAPAVITSSANRNRSAPDMTCHASSSAR